MKLRRFGDFGVNLFFLDDVTQKDEELMLASHKLVETMKVRIATPATAVTIVGALGYVATFFGIIFAHHDGVMHQTNPIVAGVLVGSVAACLVWLPTARWCHKRMVADLKQLNQYVAGSQKCREFVRAYYEADSEFRQLTDRYHPVVPCEFRDV